MPGHWLITIELLPATAAAAAAMAELSLHPAATFHAAEKMGGHLPALPPSCEAAAWVMGNAGQMPAASAVLLGRWMAEVLPEGCDANSSVQTTATATTSSSSSSSSNSSSRRPSIG